MMKKILIVVCILIGSMVKGQNLVPNPSFELYDTCPTAFEQISRATGWSSCGGSPDYFNACASYPYGVPSNFWGYQQAINGNAYAVVATYDGMNFTNIREFIISQLLQSLQIGTKYFVSCYISRCDNIGTNGASNKFGFRFSTIQYLWSNPCPVDNFSHVHSDSIITDSIHWTRIAGSFIADNTYQYIIIGNFYDQQHTDTLDINNNTATYYVDAIDVSTDSIYDRTWTGVQNKIIPQKQIDIFPIPANDFMYINNVNNRSSFEIIDCLGQTKINGNLNKNKNEVDVSTLSNGIYFLILDKQKFYKILINH